jgi:hypothetical protein
MDDPKNIVILGFYHRNNLGDDCFEDAFRHVFKNLEQFKLRFINTDDIKVLPKGTDVVICGGGDIVNEYFYSKIAVILEMSPWFTGPVYSISVGIPHHDVVERGILDCCDYTCLRFKEDVSVCAKRYGNENVSYLPDITCVLDFDKIEPRPRVETSKLRIAVFLARPICHNVDNYMEMCREIATSLDHMANDGCEIVLASFNTDEFNKREDDRVINRHVFSYVEKKSNITVTEERFNFETIQSFIKTFDLCICMRYHAHVFSLMNGVPLIALNCANKVGKLLRDTGYPQELVYNIEKSKDPEVNYPDMILSKEILRCYQNFRGKSTSVRENITNIKRSIIQECGGYRQLVSNLLQNNKKRKLSLEFNPKRRLTPPHFIKQGEMEQAKLNLLNHLIKEICPSFSPEEIKNICQQIISGNLKFYDLVDENHNDEHLADMLAKFYCYFVTGSFTPPYHYGIKQKILRPDYNFNEEYKWLIRDWNTNNVNPMTKRNSSTLTDIQQPTKGLDMSKLDQLNYHNVHRSGWQYVVDNMMPLHEENAPILDLYMDKTFGWMASMYSRVGIIPFNKPWVGFIHHTFEVDYSGNNAVKMFESPQLIESLPLCKGMFVLSNYLAKKLRDHLKLIEPKLNGIVVSDIPISVLYHPTEVSGFKPFTLKNFMNNPEKKVIQIGAWLRQSYAIYELPIYAPEKDDGFWYKNSLKLRKAALKGKNMSNHFRPRRINIQMKNDEDEKCTELVYCGCNAEIQTEKTCRCDQESFPNKYVMGLLQHIERNDSSVEIIESLDNDEYDELLSENIVFLELIDVSAANTILECIARKTPILVNKHPAVVEYIGADYPFYYENMREAADKATNFEYILKAHNYLKAFDSEKLTIEKFWKDFLNSEVYANVCK